MFLGTSTLIFITAVMYECHAEQVLKCPFGSKNPNLQRVWCKRDANNPSCCTGFSFKAGASKLDGGHLSVSENSDAFTVSMRSVTKGDGVYWCGLKNDNGTIIKLAETEIHKSMDYVWAVLRYVFFVLLLLLLSLMLSHIHCSGRNTKVNDVS